MIDNDTAAFSPIYPVWHTGGYSPSLWRTISGHTAHNLHPFTLDLTPFLGTLNDGRPHTITLVLGNAFGDYWLADANLLLWQAMDQLAQRGIQQLDLGGVNTARSAGIARFKIGTGGEVRQLAGTYL